MEYQKTSTTTGAWVKKEDLKDVKTAKIVSETIPQPSQFKNKDGSPKTQDVCKVKFEGKDEVVNVSLNKATINGLIDAFGKNSIDWQEKDLSVEIEKMRVSGVSRIAIYLIPEGFERVDDENGYAVIVKIGGSVPKNNNIPVIEDDEEIKTEDIPF